jgi:hypothetical protein
MNRVKESIAIQKVEGRPLDKSMIDKNITKNFSSGRKMQEGDFLLFGIILINKEEDLINKEEKEYKLVSFHEDEIGTFYECDSEMYEIDPFKKFDNILPYLKIK